MRQDRQRVRIVARMKLKRQILDALDKAHDFALPETLVDQRVRRHLEAGDAEPGAGRQDLRRRGQERGRAQGRVPQDRGAAGAPRPRHRRDRREGQGAGGPGRAAPGADRAGAPLSRARRRFVYEYLREEPGSADRAARADLRGQGDRPHPRAGQAGRQEGDGRGAAEARSRTRTRTCTSATAMPTITGTITITTTITTTIMA